MKRKNRAHVPVGIGILVIMLCGAFYTPTLVSGYFDNRTFGSIHTRQMELSTYEIVYSNFAEKMHAMGRASEEGARVEMFWFCNVLEDAEADRKWEETKQRIDGEISFFLNHWLGLDEELNDYELVMGEGYRVYGSSDEVDELWVGNQVYWLEYQGKEDEEKVMTFLVDQEFAKIYSFGLQMPRAQCEELTGDVGQKIDEYFFFDYWGMTQDYGIKSIELEQEIEVGDGYVLEVFGGTRVYFGEDASMEFSKIYTYDKKYMYITAGVMIPSN